MSLRVGYILQEFPRYSETFILNELRALSELRLPKIIFCLRGGAPSNPMELGVSAPVENVGTNGDDVESLLSHWIDVFEQRPVTLMNELQSAHRKYVNRPDSMRVSRRLEPFFALACAIRIAARCQEVGISHLHCHYATLPTDVGVLVYRLAGITYSFTGHAKDIFTMSPDRLARRISRSTFAVACSDTGREFMIENAKPTDVDRVHCIYHGIDTNEWNVGRDGNVEPDTIVSVGRLTPKKGFETLIEAAGILRDGGRAVKVHIIGEGRMREEYLKQVTSLGLDSNITLHGALSQDEIKKFLKRAAVFVLPSVVLPTNNQDGIANSVLEAIAAGVPVVVSDVKALGEIVEHENTGYVFPSGDSQALAQTLSQVIDNPHAAKACAVAARERVSLITPRNAATRLAALFADYAG